MPESLQQIMVAKLRAVVTSSHFDNAIVVFIFANCVTMAMTDPRWTAETTPPAFAMMDAVFTLVFVSECTLKLMVHGRAYLDSRSNLLDIVVASESLASYMPGTEAMVDLSILKTFRLLRPLRTLKRLPELRRTLAAVIGSLTDLGDTLLMMLVVLALGSITARLLWQVADCLGGIRGWTIGSGAVAL